MDVLTQRNWRARLSRANPVTPLGKMALSKAMFPFRTRVLVWRSFSVGVPKCRVRVVSVVPSRNCAPESHRYMAFGSMIEQLPLSGW